MFFAQLREGQRGFCGTKSEIKQFAQDILKAIESPQPQVNISDNVFGKTTIYFSIQPESEVKSE